MDKIEFEEWMLKGVHEGRGVRVLKEGEEGVQERIEVSDLLGGQLSKLSCAFRVNG